MTRRVICRNVKEMPTFPDSYRYGRIVDLMDVTDDFDLETLTNANGYRSVRLINADESICNGVVVQGFKNIFCSAHVVSMTTTTATTTNTREHPPNLVSTVTDTDSTSVLTSQGENKDHDDDFTGRTNMYPTPSEFYYGSQTTAAKKDSNRITSENNAGVTEGQENLESTSTNKGLGLWVSVSSCIGMLIIICILVSLLQLHHRLNKNTGADDPPQYAVKCCLWCLSCMIFPLHLCARICHCNCCDLMALDKEYRRQRPGRYNGCSYSNQGFVQLVSEN